MGSSQAKRYAVRKAAAVALLALGACLKVPSGARAADAVPNEPEVLAAPEGLGTPIYVWSGPYAGGFVGYNRAEFDNLDGASADDGGLVGGVYGGYNFQSGPLLFGVEGDLGGSEADVDGDFSSADTGLFGSLRGRVGVVVDPFLAYVTGGLAVAESQLSSPQGTDTKVSTGYTVGAGVEAKITDDISTRLEYRYSDYGSETYDLGNTSVSSGFDEHSIRAGVAVEF